MSRLLFFVWYTYPWGLNKHLPFIPSGVWPCKFPRADEEINICMDPTKKKKSTSRQAATFQAAQYTGLVLCLVDDFHYIKVDERQR